MWRPPLQCRVDRPSLVPALLRPHSPAPAIDGIPPTVREWIRSDEEVRARDWAADWARIDAAAARIERASNRRRAAVRTVLFGVGLWLLAILIAVVNRLVTSPDPGTGRSSDFIPLAPMLEGCGGAGGPTVLVGALALTGFLLVVGGLVHLAIVRTLR